MGRGAPDLCPQDHHGPPRSVQNQAPAGGHQRLPAHVRERIRRFRRGTRLGVDLGGLRHGQGGRTAGREVSGRGGHRRRFDDRRAGLRRAEQRRGQQAHQPAGDSERQQHGDRSGHGRAEKLPAQDFDFGPLQPLQATVVGHPFAYAAPAASLPEGGQRRQAGAAQQEQSVRKSQFPLFRTRGRPQPQGIGADASRAARYRRTQTAARHDRKGQGLPARRAQPARLACAGAVQSRYGRADFVAGFGVALSGRVRRDARRTCRTRQPRRGRHARAAR